MTGLETDWRFRLGADRPLEAPLVPPALLPPLLLPPALVPPASVSVASATLAVEGRTGVLRMEVAAGADSSGPAEANMDTGVAAFSDVTAAS